MREFFEYKKAILDRKEKKEQLYKLNEGSYKF